MSGPLREKGNESTCISNMKQLYSGNAIYAQATDSASAYPELNGLAYLPGHESMKLAYLDQRILWCPSVPDVYKKKIGTTYASALWFDPEVAGQVSEARKRVIERVKQQGESAQIVECTGHDEFYYAPGEKDIDDLVANPFKVYLRLDGSVVARRFQTIRDYPISGTIK